MLIKDLKMAQVNLNLDWRCSNISIIKGLIYQGAFVVTASVQESLILKISEIQREEETELFSTNIRPQGIREPRRLCKQLASCSQIPSVSLLNHKRFSQLEHCKLMEAGLWIKKGEQPPPGKGAHLLR